MAFQPCASASAGAGEVFLARACSALATGSLPARHLVTTEGGDVTHSEASRSPSTRHLWSLPLTMTCVRIAAHGCAFEGRLMRKLFTPDLRFLRSALARGPPARQ